VNPKEKLTKDSISAIITRGLRSQSHDERFLEPVSCNNAMMKKVGVASTVNQDVEKVSDCDQTRFSILKLQQQNFLPFSRKKKFLPTFVQNVAPPPEHDKIYKNAYADTKPAKKSLVMGCKLYQRQF
jgi:hypothetical protein